MLSRRFVPVEPRRPPASPRKAGPPQHEVAVDVGSVACSRAPRQCSERVPAPSAMTAAPSVVCLPRERSVCWGRSCPPPIFTDDASVTSLRAPPDGKARRFGKSGVLECYNLTIPCEEGGVTEWNGVRDAPTLQVPSVFRQLPPAALLHFMSKSGVFLPISVDFFSCFPIGASGGGQRGAATASDPIKSRVDACAGAP